MSDKWTTLQQLLVVATLSSLGGLAALLRSGEMVTKRAVLSALLNSGLLGLVIAFVWWEQQSSTNLYFLIGVSILAGLGGTTTVDFVVQLAQRSLKGRVQDDDKKT